VQFFYTIFAVFVILLKLQEFKPSRSAVHILWHKPLN